MKKITSNKGSMEKRFLIWFMLFALLFVSSCTQGGISTLGNSLNQQISGIKDWYSITTYTKDAQGNDVPVFNPQYLFARTFLDFILVTILIWLVLNGKNSPVKQQLGGKAPGLIALIMGFMFAFASGYGFISSFTPFVKYIPYVLLVYGIYVILAKAIIKDEKNTWGRIGLLILSIAIVTVLFLLANKFNIMGTFAGVPGFQNTGAGQDIPVSMLRTRFTAVSGDAMQQSREYLAQSIAKLDAAEFAYKNANKDAKRLEEAKSLYRESEDLWKKSYDTFMQIK